MRIVCLALAALTLAACSTHEVYDTVVPKDRRTQVAARDVSFGPLERQKLDVYAATTGAQAPVVVFLYGGSWQEGDKGLYDFVGRAFAGKGFVTVIPDYGKVPDVEFPTFLQDNALALKWVMENIANYGGYPDELFVVGHSAGAYNAAMLALDRQYLRGVGLDDETIDGVVGMSGPYDFYPFTSETGKRVFGAVPNAATTTQPVAQVRRGAPPMFLLIGSEDETVRPYNVKSLADALRQKGVRVETEVYQGLNHTDPVLVLSLPFRGRAPVLEDIVRFIESIE